jgi:predicted small secreted protein
MKIALIISVTAMALTGCSTVSGVMDRFGLGKKLPEVAVDAPSPSDPFIKAQTPIGETTLAPATAAPAPPAAAQTAAALDTTTPAQRAAAAAPTAGASRVLGKTIVSLGSPTEPGLWIKTPLVKVEGQGRVTNPANGKSSLVTLIPIEGPVTGGSRLSLSALRLIEASLTDLTEVEVALEG